MPLEWRLCLELGCRGRLGRGEGGGGVGVGFLGRRPTLIGKIQSPEKEVVVPQWRGSKGAGSAGG